MSAVVYRSGDLFGTRYTFQKGEGLPRHNHCPELQHNVIVLRGSVDVSGQTLHVGEVLNIDDGRWHQITALEDDTRILNLLLRGCPADMQSMKDGDPI